MSKLVSTVELKLEGFQMRRETGIVACLLALAGFVSGCGQTPSPKVGSSDKHAAHDDDHGDHDSKAEHGDHKHDPSGKWCGEHGVPETICTQCFSKIAAEYQKKGDWCEKHERADSQCFICHPELEEKFIAEYEVKYGKKPPKAKAD